jgi:hypothetical protein
MRPPVELQEGERIVRIVRRHWLYIYPRLVLLTLLALAPAIALWAVTLTSLTIVYPVQLGLIALSGVWLLYWAIRIFLIAYRFNNDLWTITNQRLIDSVRHHPFHLEVESADLVHVQDISIARSGVLRTVFNFGDVECQTASTGGRFTLAAVPRPADVQLLIDRLRDAQRSTIPAPP